MGAFKYSDVGDPLASPLDRILARIAINVQLPPGLHAKAAQRFQAVVDFLSREASPLAGMVFRFYPQGSMAIDATISSRGTDDDYDLDLVIELLVPPGWTPAEVLDLLYGSLKDYRSVEVVRQTRCVTLRYADRMHIDVTPSQRIPGSRKDFESYIFHAHPDEPATRHAKVPMNAFGFAEWFRQRTPEEKKFAEAYNAQLLDSYEALAKADPTVHEIPEQVPLSRKSVTTVALQLLKRFRNVWSADRAGRYPPSVMLSTHAGRAAVPGMALSEMVIRQAEWTAKALEQASRAGRRIDVRNPVMDQDCFTDRWPETLEQQDAFAAALRDLANGLTLIRDQGAEVEDIQEWLRDRFGDRVVSKSIGSIFSRQGERLHAGGHRYTRNGGLYVPSAPAIVATSSFAPIRSAHAHTNMGGRLR